MANNPNGVGFSQPMIPIFWGSNYKWSIRMKTLFISLDLWNLVERGYSPECVIADTLKRCSKDRWEGSLFYSASCDQKSTIGYLFKLGANVISWCSKKNNHLLPYHLQRLNTWLLLQQHVNRYGWDESKKIWSRSKRRLQQFSIIICTL